MLLLSNLLRLDCEKSMGGLLFIPLIYCTSLQVLVPLLFIVSQCSLVISVSIKNTKTNCKRQYKCVTVQPGFSRQEAFTTYFISSTSWVSVYIHLIHVIGQTIRIRKHRGRYS